MNTQQILRTYGEVLQSIDIPESSYELAATRYKDLGEWFRRPDSALWSFVPHVYPQGSFRLGTVVRPLTEDCEYDLDLGCRLTRGATKQTHTQANIKALVGQELAAYRIARQIKQPLEEMHRCWRLLYADKLKFHLDAVPSIPESASRRLLLTEAMTRAGISAALAASVASHAGAITDNRAANYRIISDSWRISNSEGYALWFQSRIKLAGGLLEQRALQARVGRIDDLPTYKWKSPLQACIQILKRHRDVMFESDPSGQPISIIITTLAGHAYGGETDVSLALSSILSSMDRYIRSESPRIANPVNPAEDFADKWAERKYAHLGLEDNFRRWLSAARTDLAWLAGTGDAHLLMEGLNKRFKVRVPPAIAASIVGTSNTLLRQQATPELSFPNKPMVPTKPAGFA